jgi:Ni/Co efflux regulator RcnB
MKMLTKLVFCLAAAGTIAPAFAFDPPQNYNHRDDHRDDHHDNRHDDRHDRHDDRNDHRGPPAHARWERGHRYDGRVYVVNDYRTRHLREPPRGYHWVRAEDNTSEFLLVAIATGIIADIAMQ